MTFPTRPWLVVSDLAGDAARVLPELSGVAVLGHFHRVRRRSVLVVVSVRLDAVDRVSVHRAILVLAYKRIV